MRQALVTITAVALVLLLGWLGYTWVFGGHAETLVTIEAVEGRVERDRQADPAQAVAAGDQLEAYDTLRVHGPGFATLAVGDSTRLRLSADSSLQIVDVAEDGVRVTLENGRVEANVRPDSPRLSITAANRTTTASDARFVVGADDQAVGVSVERGSVQVDGTQVEAGQRLSQTGEGTPILRSSDEDLLLQVAWPETPALSATLQLSGSTEPGALVQVAGGTARQSGRADSTGRFTLEVPVSDGNNTLTVSARDALGRGVSVAGSVDVDATAPAARSIHVSWGK